MRLAAVIAVVAGAWNLAVPRAASATPPVAFNRVDPAVGATPFAVATGDLNGDAIADLVAANYGSNTVSVRLGIGPGAFAPPVDYATGLQPVSVAIGDLNNDGIPDLVVCNWGGGTISTIPGLGGGVFGPRTDLPAGGSRPISGRLVHLDVDNRLDLVFVLRNHGLVCIWKGNGAGGFTSTTTYSTAPISFPYSVALGDLHGDGEFDLIVGTDAAVNQVVVFPGYQGTLFPSTAWTVGTQPISVALGDLNNDGKGDLIAANQADGTVSVRLGDGANGFGPKVDFATGTGPFSVVHGYVNGDIHRDLAVVNGGANSISILLGDSNGSFLPKVDFATGTAPRGLTAGELNGDTRLDLAVANSGASTVSVFLNGSDPSELACPAGIVANGDFARGIVTGSMPFASIDSWSLLSTTPQVLGDGCGNVGSIQMWGNLGTGEAIKQRLPGSGLQAGRTYRITLCARWLDNANPILPQYVRFRLSASASEPLGYPVPAGYTVVGITPEITSTSWASFVLPNFTAPVNLTWITVNPENDFNLNDGDFMSWGVIDDICIEDLSSPTSGVVELDPLAGSGGDRKRSPGLSLVSAGPNPTRGPSTIRFSLARPADVELRVHDLRGAEVYRRRAVGLSAGSHLLGWDGLLASGRRAPGGVYYFRLGADADDARGKLILLR